MASPQLERGHVRIANDLYEALCRADIPSTCLRLILWILRQSYGYNKKKTNPIGVRELARKIGSPSSTVHRSINSLIEYKMLNRDSADQYALNKDYETWSLPTVPPAGQSKVSHQRDRVSHQRDRVSHQRDKSVSPVGHSSRGLNTKDNYKDNSKDIGAKAPKELTPVQRVVNAYKEVKGVGLEDKDWDEANYGRYAKSAALLLKCFGTWKVANVFVISQGKHFDEVGRTWTLETIVRHAFDNHGGKNGATQKPVDGDGQLESRRGEGLASGRKGIVRAGEIVGDALAGLLPPHGEPPDAV